jgi:hypothetical protein
LVRGEISPQKCTREPTYMSRNKINTPCDDKMADCVPKKYRLPLASKRQSACADGRNIM